MIGVRWQAPERRQPTVKNLIAAEEIRARIGVTGLQVPSLLHCMSPVLAHCVDIGMSAFPPLLGSPVKNSEALDCSG